MLPNSVSSANNLKQVKYTAQQLKVSLGQELNHDGHEKLLKETSITDDAKVRVQTPRSTQRAHEYDIDYSCPPDAGELLNIDYLSQ